MNNSPQKILASVRRINLVNQFVSHYVFQFSKRLYLLLLAIFIPATIFVIISFIADILFWIFGFIVPTSYIFLFIFIGVYFLILLQKMITLNRKITTSYRKINNEVQQEPSQIKEKCLEYFSRFLQIVFWGGIVTFLFCEIIWFWRGFFSFDFWLVKEISGKIALCAFLLHGTMFFLKMSIYPKKGTFLEECVRYSQNFYEHISAYNNENLDDSLIDEMAVAIRIYNENFQKLEKILRFAAFFSQKNEQLLYTVQAEKILALREMQILFRNIERKLFAYKQKILTQIQEIENLQKSGNSAVLLSQKFRLEAQLKNFANIEKTFFSTHF